MIYGQDDYSRVMVGVPYPMMGRPNNKSSSSLNAIAIELKRR